MALIFFVPLRKIVMISKIERLPEKSEWNFEQVGECTMSIRVLHTESNNYGGGYENSYDAFVL